MIRDKTELAIKLISKLPPKQEKLYKLYQNDQDQIEKLNLILYLY